MMDKGLEDSKVLEELSIKDITIERINKVKLEDFYNYLYYILRQLRVLPSTRSIARPAKPAPITSSIRPPARA